jgi:pyruvate/2-oxoglutarate dehydrogenase complex dihydrolipoamide acyltransferase (E2) component
MKLYAYCLTDEPVPPALADVKGVDDEPLRLFACGALTVVVSNFNDATVALTHANVLAHERVNGQILTALTPLPFRFGTLTDEARLRSYITTHEATLRAQLARVRGCVEMSVKVIWRPKDDSATSPATADSPAGAQPAAGAAQRGTGTAFLQAKRRALAGDERTRARAEELASWLSAQLKEIVRAERVTLRPTGAILLAAAHLCARAGVAEYRARLHALFAERAEWHILTSGPWPPYSFSQGNSLSPTQYSE